MKLGIAIIARVHMKVIDNYNFRKIHQSIQQWLATAISIRYLKYEREN